MVLDKKIKNKKKTLNVGFLQDSKFTYQFQVEKNKENRKQDATLILLRH